MSLQKPTIVIFDMDGTAVRHINPRLLHILEWLDNLSYKSAKIFAWVFKKKGKGRIVPEWHDTKKDKRPRLLVHRAIHKVRRKPVEQIVEPSPGIYDVLDLLQHHNVPMALVSNGLGKGYGYDILQKFELEKYFKVSIFREDIVNSKPHPEPILTALQQLKDKTDKTDIVWYIGDRHKDVTAALAASKLVPATIVPIGFAINAAAAIIEKNIGTDHIIMSFHDMFDQIKPMFETNSPNKDTPAPTTSTAAISTKSA